MRATRFNHVSISAVDMDESLRFYTEIFGMERIPSPDFSGHVEWLRLGDQQLHLFKDGSAAPERHHLALDVDDFEGVYHKAKALGLLDETAWGWKLRSHPTGWVQMYLRDPAGNLVEVDWPDVGTLDRSVVTDLTELDAPQVGEQLTATLYLEPATR